MCRLSASGRSRANRPYFYFALVVIACPLFLSSCLKVGPDYRRPAVSVAPGWLESADQRVKTEPAEYRNWWQQFQDPVLDRLIDRAYRDNLSLRIAGVRVLEARAQLGIAVGQLFPQTQQATGSLQYNRLSDRSTSAVFFSNIQYAQSQIGLAAIWELDFWGKFRRGIESADANFLATVADYDNTLVTLTADVANTYIQIRTLEKRIGVARQNIETQKESFRIAETRFRYGATTQRDVEQARTLLNNTLAFLPVLESQRQQARDALSVLLGLPPGDLAEALSGAEEIPVPPPQIALGIPADLLRRRPDIRAAEFQARAQGAQIGVAKADLYPAFSLNGNFGFLSTNVGNFKLGDMFRWGARTYSAGPSAQWNLFNYGRITNNVRVQDARFQELLIGFQNAVLTAQQEVEDALAAFLRSRDAADFLAIGAAAAQRSLDLAVAQYRAGVTDFTTVLSAQQALLSVQDNLAATLGNIASAMVGVYRGLGGGWEIREDRDLLPPEIKEEMARRTNWGRLLAPAAYNPPPSREPKSSPQLPDW